MGLDRSASCSRWIQQTSKSAGRHPECEYVTILDRLLDGAARSNANLMPLLVECVENYVTLGEICDVMRGVFGEQREFMVI